MVPSAFLKRLIHDFRGSTNPILYFGAGISTSPPSSIPTFSGLMRAYLDAINETGANILERHGGDKAENIKELICDKIPIESFFAVLQESVPSETKVIQKPLEWMDSREPKIRPTNYLRK